MSQTNTRTVSRPAQGDNATRKNRPPRPAYQPEPAPKVVSRGTVSRPVPLKKWNPQTLPQDKPGRVYTP